MTDDEDEILLNDSSMRRAWRAAGDARLVLQRLSNTMHFGPDGLNTIHAADSALRLAQDVLSFPGSVPGRRPKGNTPDDFLTQFGRSVRENSLDTLAQILASFDSRLEEASILREATLELMDALEDVLGAWLSETEDTSLGRAVGADGVVEWLRDRLSETRTARRIFELTSRLESATEQSSRDAATIEERREATAEAAGVVAEGSLANEFASIAKAERRPALFFQTLTILLFIGTIAYAAVVAYESREPSVELAQRLSVAIPVLLLAGYFSRESTRHRRAQRWATVLTAQLRTINAYTAQLDDSNAAVLLQTFGQRVFMSSPDGVDSASDDSDATGSLLAGSADLARAIRGTPP
jgi:hypothetical protein